MSTGTRRSPIFAQAAETWAAMKAEFDLELEAHISAAESATRGYLLSPEARATGISVDRLFTANRTSAAAWASEELRDFWTTHPRPTLAAFERAWFTGQAGAGLAAA